jgi:CCR4-Not complex component, Not1/CCR4-NOT transcription complex subunit 1 CAF1-binding domain/Domain of unknown function (DUF3819)/CCR4-NOT transcription complex subunit 1 TTP binding domain
MQQYSIRFKPSVSELFMEPAVVDGGPPGPDQQFLERVFSGQLSISQAATELASMQVSDSISFQLVKNSILDEIRYVPKYPIEDLKIAGNLIGTLLVKKLLPFSTLSHIVEALRRPSSSKLFKFGATVFVQLLPVVHKHPLFVHQVIAIVDFKNLYPSYFDYLLKLSDLIPQHLQSVEVLDDPEISKNKPPCPPAELAATGPVSVAPAVAGAAPAGTEEREESRRERTGSQPNSLVAQNQSVESILNQKTLLESSVPVPTEVFIDQISHLCNSLSTQNVNEKATELKSLLSVGDNQQYLQWLGYYFVKHRVIKETNMYPTYLTVINQIPKLPDAVVNLTYASLKLLLAHAKEAVHSSVHRAAIKNLGSWLGLLTIARDKPLKSKDLDLKQMLLDGYEKGHLSVVVPLICKIISCCKDSKAYRPPNAWTTALLSLLAEIHDLPGLKTNLVFEVEVLCQGLGISLMDYRRPDLLSSRTPPPAEISDDFVKRPMPLASALAPEAIPAPTQMRPPAAVQMPVMASSLPPINPVISPSIMLFQLQPKLKPLVAIAIERGIREVVQGVIDRSVHIACLTTKELIAKDFHSETDETVIRKAAEWMVGALASSLAMVTAKEPLKLSLAQQLKQVLSPGIADESGLIEQVVQVVSADNIEIACGIVEKIVVEKATKDIGDQVIAVLAGKKGIASLVPNQIPLTLRQKSGQFGCYKEFSSVAPSLSAASSPVPSGIPAPMTPPPPPPAPPAPSAHQQVIGQLRQMAESHESSDALRELITLVTVDLEQLCRRLSADESILTLPEVVENQPMFLDAYYGLISSSNGWLEYLRKVDNLIKSHKSLSSVLVHYILASLNSRLDLLSGSMNAESFTCSVTEHFLYLEISFALISCVVTSAPEMAETVVYASMHGYLVQMLNTRLIGASEQAITAASVSSSDSTKTALLYLGITMLRYSLVKETEVDKLFTSLLTMQRSLTVSLFVTQYLYILICKMRMSPLSHWPSVIDLIAKLGNRVRETGMQNIPLSEKQLASQLELFMKEGRTVANLSIDRVISYRLLHCLSVSGPQQLPADIVEYQSVKVSPYSLVSKLSDPIRITQNADKKNAIQSLLDQYRLASTERRAKYWQTLKNAGMSFDQQSTEWTECVFSGGVDRIFELLGDINESDGLNYVLIDWFPSFALSLAKDAFNSPEMSSSSSASDTPKFKVFRKAVEAVGKILTEKLNNSSGGDLLSPVISRVFSRLLLQLWSEFVSMKPESGMWISGLASQFVRVLGSIGPVILPQFSFAWLEVIAHRDVLPKLLSIRGQRAWLAYGRLLQQPFILMKDLSTGESAAAGNSAMVEFQKGLTRLLLVLLHDFPEFLCNYQHLFVAVLPLNQVQLRNLVLSAFPKSMKLPDPFQANLNLRLLVEVKQVPRYLKPESEQMEPIRKLLASGEISSTVLGQCRQKLQELKYEAGIMQEFVYYLGVVCPVRSQVNKIAGSLTVGSGTGSSSSLDLFMEMLVSLDSEGRYCMLSAMVTFLRYPESHTCFFSQLIQSLFKETSSGVLKEAVVRVLLERLIVHRPHPWGLLVTFVSLIRDPGFWPSASAFMNADVEKVFNTVAATCIGGGITSRN